MLDSNLVREFRRLTKYDLDTYLLSFSEFAATDVSRIVAYYSGRTKDLPNLSVNLLNSLVAESKRIDHIISLNSRRFQTLDYWDLVEVLEDIKTKLQTVLNTPKWVRSSNTNSKVSAQIQSEFVLKQQQTLERLAGVELGSNNEQEDWVDIALANDVKEEDYTSQGGLIVKASNQNNKSFSILSIVDIINSETIKGKDIYHKITWEDNDLKVVTSDTAFLQALDILINLKKGDNPEFSSQGLGREVAVGENINSLSYPVLTRQLDELFTNDDSIASFSLSRIERVEDGVFLEFTIVSKGAEEFKINTVF